MNIKEILLTKINKIKADKNALIILKGFSNDIFNAIVDEVDYVFFTENYNQVNYLDILFKNKRKLSKKLAIIEEGIYLARYEEIYLVKEHLDLYDNKIYIIENNIFKYYKYELKNNDLLLSYMEKKETEYFDDKEHIYSIFFGDIILEENLVFVIFKEIEHKNINIINIYNNDNSDVINFRQEKSNKNDIEIYPFNNNPIKVEILKDEIINSDTMKELSLILDESYYKNRLAQENLKILSYLCKLKNIQFNCYKKEKNNPKYYRKDFSVILKKYWNSDKFRALNFYADPDKSNEKISISQGEIIEEIVFEIENSKNNKKYNNIFITAPTGSGKSIFFQIPAIYIKEKYNYLTIVITPLKSLMKDQIDNLKNKGIDYACFLNSDLSFVEKEKSIQSIKDGDISIVYLSPELLQINSDIEQLIGNREIGCIIIDEAHIVSTWGKNFRIDYLLIGNYVNKIKKHKNYEFPIVALTATAIYNGENDTVFEIIKALNLNSVNIRIGEVRKENIEFNIQNFIPSEGSYDFLKAEFIKKQIQKKIIENKKTIFYFPYANQVTTVYSSLNKEIQKLVACYSGKLFYEEKEGAQFDFKNNNKKIMLATKAFGMGIDIPDIEEVYHYALSGDLADYVQEIGRCARDKNSVGIAEIHFNKKDLKYSKLLRGMSSVKQWQIRLVLSKILELFKLNNNKQNLLISIESFSHIFLSEDLDLESKLKQSLLFLEKDLIERYTYPIIIARPKVFFTSLYVVINDNAINKILNENEKIYFKKIRNKEENYRIRKTFGYKGEEEIIQLYDTGDIYEFSIAKYWEDNYAHISYPSFIRAFFKGEIFDLEDVSNRIKLKLELKNERDKTIELLNENLKLIGETIKELKGFFTKEELEKALSFYFIDNTNIYIKKLCNFLLSSCSYVANQNMSLNGDKFFKIKKDMEKNEEKYSVIYSNFLKYKSNIIRDFYEFFNSNDLICVKYISKESRYTILSTIIQIFEFGSYEITGGGNSKIFIRINDPIKLITLSCNDKYQNKILSDIEKTGRKADLILESFFTTDMDSKQRWNYIEDYFLGRL